LKKRVNSAIRTVKIAAIGFLVEEIKEWEKWMELWMARKYMSSSFSRDSVKHVGDI
jgi:hypothetical protein